MTHTIDKRKGNIISVIKSPVTFHFLFNLSFYLHFPTNDLQSFFVIHTMRTMIETS